MYSDKSIVKFNRKHGHCVRIAFVSPFLTVAFLLVFLFAWKPIGLTYLLALTKNVALNIANDKQRFLDNDLHLTDKGWKLNGIEKEHHQVLCKKYALSWSKSNATWLTILTNDDYAIPLLVLGHSIRTFSCQKNMIALISKDVKDETREVLRKVGWTTRLVEEMDCDWIERKLRVDPSNGGFFQIGPGRRIKGTHTRLHAWNYTEFSKVVYIDADVMLLRNIDELFDINEDFAAAPCSRPGILDPCFNAGLLVLRPDSDQYREILELWGEITARDTCLTDQELLNIFYANVGTDWKFLPYSYNVRRFMFRPLSAFHFVGSSKPWISKCRPSRKEASQFQGPTLNVEEMAVIFWKRFYKLLSTYSLETWYQSTKFFRREQEFGNIRFADCLNMEPRPYRSPLEGNHGTG